MVSIMAHILKTLKSEHPDINQAFFRHDNTGCYHSTYTILSVPTIEREAGIRIAEIGFSDPQGGNGPADRMAATIKGHITRFINEGNNVTNAKEVENAILSHGGLPGIRVVMLDSLGEPKTVPTMEQKVTGISKLNNFRCYPAGMRLWQAFDRGHGNAFLWKEQMVNLTLYSLCSF